MRYVILSSLFLLASCSSAPWVTGHTDSKCIREQMLSGAQGNPRPFATAASLCAAAIRHDNGGHDRPLDVRDDTTLQAMAENPDFNTTGLAFVPRDSKTRIPGGIRNINID
ncbi:hypothetical protein JK202_07800 [Gluconobacter sp. Dm-62]|uniref:hypothetical protein n=1 Tax=Gluconobacter sp. Dm-62 TaxID=2799804 RepID=UPI001B8D13F7|nr:hypothetical protein [Gluconobacter sp. Dm-62]MBS1102921.1 hypothetical protein [Gluconobacter sp. Dm-62]